MDGSFERGPFISRVLVVVLTVSAGLALAGFLVGTRPAPTPKTKTGPEKRHVSSTRPEARTYGELRAERANRPASREVRDLMGGVRMTAPRSRATSEQKAAALAARAERRAFNGAPPVIPHGVDARSSGACLTCHAKGARVQDKVAPPIPHPPYANCIQCHVPQTSRLGAVVSLPANRFVGAPSPGPSRRAWIGAPPTIPHTTWMRQHCIACHGPAARPGLRTTHPQRASCTQCHAPGTHLNPTGLIR